MKTMSDVLGVTVEIRSAIISAVNALFGMIMGSDQIQLENPPKANMGDLAWPCFGLAKQLKQNPVGIAQQLAQNIRASGVINAVSNAGPYLNFDLNPLAVKAVIESIQREGQMFGHLDQRGQTVMVEYSGPNSNKAMHLGHLRNNMIGLTLCNILRATGYSVIPVNIINDRGIAICRSMVAYRRWAAGQTPTSLGVKGDHYVGQLYAQFMEEVEKELAQWLASKGMTLEEYKGLDEEIQKPLTKEFEGQSSLTTEAFATLRQWEANDPATRELWRTMNGWVFEGFDQTYARQGVVFDKVYLESDTYELGRQIAMDHLANGRCRRDARDNIVIDLTEDGLGEKVLVRADGTTVYITQDIGTAVVRFNEFDPLSQLIYVVANEQRHHFQVLFKMLARFGYQWAGRCYHRSYGMVNLPTGKMSSRKLKQGGVFLADDLMNHLHELARTAILDREPELLGDELEDRAEKIALAALKYWLLKTNPDNDVVFVPEESLKFEGNTGPYLLYAYARISSILRKTNSIAEVDLTLLADPKEMALAKALATFPQKVELAAETYNPSLVANQLYEIARAFSQWYGTCQIFGAEVPNELSDARLMLVSATASVLQNGLCLMGIQTLERM